MINLIGISGYIGAGKDETARIIQQLCKEEYEYFYWDVKKFAGKLKQIAALLTGIPAEKFEDQDFKKAFLSRDWDYLVSKPGLRQDGWPGKGEKEIKQFEVRLFLQKLGTEAIRDSLHTNAWVNALFADYKSKPCPKMGNKVVIYGSNWWKEDTKEFVEPETHPELFGEWWPYWIVTDVRFPNEAQAIKDRGGVVVRINRYTVKPDSQEKVKRHPSETSLDIWNFDYTINNNGTIEQLEKNVKEMLVHFKILENGDKS